MRRLVSVRKKLFTFIGVTAFLLLTNTFASEETIYKCQIEPRLGENFSYGVFECWMPPNETKPKGILCIVLHPHDSRGAILANPKPWQELAAYFGCVLISASFSESSDLSKPWGKAYLGSGRALLAALDRFSNMTKSKEISLAPIVLAGVCQAGQFALSFAAYEPKRTVAFITIGGGKHDTHLTKQVSKTPALFVGCEDRENQIKRTLFELFSNGRKLDAPWCWASGLMSNYDQGMSEKSVLYFLTAILNNLNSQSGKMSLTQGKLNPINDHAIAYKNVNSWSPILNKSFLIAEKPISFVSVPVEDSAAFQEGKLDLGAFSFQQSPEFTVTVACHDPAIKRFWIVKNPYICATQFQKISKSLWRVKSKFNADTLPSGGFLVDMPLRFGGEKDQILGGAQLHISGSVYGDVKPVPKSFILNNVSFDAGKIVTLTLTSESETPIHLLKISSESASITTFGMKPNDINRYKPLEIKLHVFPPDHTSGSFLFFANLTIRSNETRDLKIMFMGTTTKGSN